VSGVYDNKSGTKPGTLGMKTATTIAMYVTRVNAANLKQCK